jgi:bacteriorhodopsin
VGEYRHLLGALTVVFVAYAVVWGAGESGLRLWRQSVDVPVFLAFDLAGDVAFGVVDAVLISRLAGRLGPQPGQPAIAASAARRHDRSGGGDPGEELDLRTPDPAAEDRGDRS